MEEKLKCTKCGQEKEKKEFYKDSKAKNREFASYSCKECYKLYSRSRREIQREKRQNISVEDREAKKLYMKEYRKKNRKKLNKQRMEWVRENKQKYLDNDKRWRDENKEKRAESTSKWRKEKLRTDPEFRIAVRLRKRFSTAIQNNTTKMGSSVRNLGCTVPECKIYLESLFTEGMSWGNYGHGKGKWNIDHIIPLHAYDLENMQHVVLACYYLNLQPLWHEDNIKKNKTYPDLGF